MKVPIAFRIRHTTTAALVLLAAYFAYDLTVVRYLTPPVVEALPLKVVAARRTQHGLEDLFADDAWQNKACKRFQTPDAMLLFDKWEPRGKNSWKVSPVTIVYGRGLASTGNERPMVLESVEGAEIEFADSVDLLGGSAPPIHRGRLIGKVTVVRPGDPNPDAKDNRGDQALRMETTDIVVDKKRLYTTSTIDLTIGKTRMVGRDLTLHLSGGGIREVVPDRVELIYLERLTLPIDASGTAPASEVRIGCKGTVEYDFALSTLSMQDNVQIERVAIGGVQAATFHDSFVADDLRLTLREVGGDARRETLDDWISQISATGHPVVAKMPSMDVSVTAETLLWRVAEGVFQAGGRQGIELIRGDVSARLAAIDYRYDPAQPKILGTALADGAGIVTMNDPTSELRTFRWRKSLEMKPESDTPGGPLSITMAGGCDFETNSGGGHADWIGGRLIPDPVAAETYVPERFDIRGNIAIDDSRLNVRTDRMQLFFRPDPNPQSRVVQRNDRIQPTAVHQPVAHSGGATPTSINSKSAAPAPTLRGDLIAIEIQHSPRGYEPRRLSIDGSLSLATEVMSGNLRLPTVLRGDRLQWNGGDGQDVLQLLGSANKPAKLSIDDGFLIGPEIQVRRLDNLIWMKEAGEFQIPSAMIAAKPGAGDTAIQWIVPPHCRFSGEMLFDGDEFKLDGGVDVDARWKRDGETSDMTLSGDKLVAKMNRAVELMGLGGGQPIAARDVTLTGSATRPVIAETVARAEDGTLASRHKFHADRLRVEPTSAGTGLDTLTGTGPGWYRGWFVGGQSKLPGQKKSGATAGSSITTAHMLFRDWMNASMTNREVKFGGGVRVAMGDVASMDDAIDASTMAVPPTGVSLLDCNSLRLSSAALPNNPYRDRSAPIPIEVQAEGAVRFQTHVDGGMVVGDASMATYASSNDLFVVRGMPQTPARVRVTDLSGQPTFTGTIEILAVHPREMTIEHLKPLRFEMPVPQTAMRGR